MGATSFALIMISAYPKGVFCVYILFSTFFFFFLFMKEEKKKGLLFFILDILVCTSPRLPSYICTIIPNALFLLYLCLSLSLFSTNL